VSGWLDVAAKVAIALLAGAVIASLLVDVARLTGGAP
jgi:hypothetical protein